MMDYINNFLNSEWHKKIFLNIIHFSLALLILSFIGINFISPQYLESLENILHVYISIMLIGKFNPFINKKNGFDKYDKNFAFSAGIALLLSTSLTHIFDNYIK